MVIQQLAFLFSNAADRFKDQRHRLVILQGDLRLQRLHQLGHQQLLLFYLLFIEIVLLPQVAHATDRLLLYFGHQETTVKQSEEVLVVFLQEIAGTVQHVGQHHQAFFQTCLGLLANHLHQLRPLFVLQSYGGDSPNQGSDALLNDWGLFVEVGLKEGGLDVLLVANGDFFE